MDPFIDILRRDGVITTVGGRLVPLTGGVSSEIYRVEDGPRTFVVKRALEKLRVEADWRADVSRNRFERMYLERAGRIVPGAFPEVLSSHDGYFTMEWLGGDWENWKSRMLTGDCRPEDASAAGRVLGRIHAETTGNSALLAEFDTTPNFIQLRLDPYLMELARKYPGHRPHIEAEIDSHRFHRECLVHGDYSPKNMLFSGERLVVLDCEVASYGDPAFDLAFLLNHLFLKALTIPPAAGISAMFTAAREAYIGGERSLPDQQDFDVRTAGVLLLLMLARVDGKSPVEYLPPEIQERVREFVLPRLETKDLSLTDLQTAWLQS